MTAKKTKPFYENDEEWAQDVDEAVKKLDKRMGWVNVPNGNGDGNDNNSNTNGNNENQPSEEWTYQKLAERYEHLKNVTLNSMPEIWQGLEFALSVKTILNIEGCTLPFIGILLGPASSTKTLIIELFRGSKHTFYTDNFSPKSLVSHNPAVAKDKLREVDMLPKIKNKFFLTPELAPTFAAREDDLLQTLGVLTRVADGHGYESDSGAQGHRGYNEDIMFSWLGAAVDIPYKVHRLLGTLGPKIYFFRLPRKEESEDYYFNARNESFIDKQSVIRKALLEYLVYFEMNPKITFDSNNDNELPKIAFDQESDESLAFRIIIRLAKLMARLRATVPTWETKDSQGSQYNYAIANVEIPSRAITQLYNLARGHALSKGRRYVTLDDIPIVIQTALSTATMERVRILDILVANKGTLTTSEVVEFLNTTKPTALRTMTELKATGLVTMDYDQEEYNAPREIKLKPEFDWFLSDEFAQLRSCKEKCAPRDRSTDETDPGACKGKCTPRADDNQANNNNTVHINNKLMMEVSFLQGIEGTRGVHSSLHQPKIYFLNGHWHCEECKEKGDRFYMHEHKCNGKKESKK